MRALAVAASIALLATSAVAASQPVAKVQLPCESRDQTLSPTGTQLVVACKDHSLHLVSIGDGKERLLPFGNDRPGRPLQPVDRRTSAVAFSPDGRWLALGYGDGTVQVLSTDDLSITEWKAAARRIDLLYFLPDATGLVVAPLDSPGQVWPNQRTLSITLLYSLPVDFGGISAVAASPDGKLLVTAAGDTVLRWYDTATRQKTKEYRGFLLDTFALQFTPDGKQLVAAGADSRITVLDPATAKVIRQTPPEPSSFIISVDLLDGGRRAVALYADNAGEKPPHALIWDLAAGKSAPLKFDAMPTCGGVVNGKLWLCTTDGKALTITQQD